MVRLPLREVQFEYVIDHPVAVSLAEATAFTEWYQKTNKLDFEISIPTETQWCQAIDYSSDIPKIYKKLNHYHVGQIGKIMEPMKIIENINLETREGISHLIGNAWELTSTPFYPFENFISEPYYSEYSNDFFDNNHYVLKGGSWATPVGLIRPSFRNFYQDLYRYHITQFRMCCNNNIMITI